MNVKSYVNERQKRQYLGGNVIWLTWCLVTPIVFLLTAITAMGEHTMMGSKYDKSGKAKKKPAVAAKGAVKGDKLFMAVASKGAKKPAKKK